MKSVFKKINPDSCEYLLFKDPDTGQVLVNFENYSIFKNYNKNVWQKLPEDRPSNGYLSMMISTYCKLINLTRVKSLKYKYSLYYIKKGKWMTLWEL